MKTAGIGNTIGQVKSTWNKFTPEYPIEYKFLDENFEPHTETFYGITARIILHEYDHIEGKLFIDYITPLKRKLMKGKLDDISKGKVDVDYKMSFPG